MADVFRDGVFEGRTALVTGGGTGIGRATALQLARLGARVAVSGRRAEPLEETAALAQAAGVDVLAYPCDVRETGQVDALLDAVLEANRRVDILVNNAGGQFVSPAEAITYNGMRAVTRVNYEAVWYLTNQVANRSMIPNGYGKVVSVTMTPRRAMPGMSHSSAARAAVESMTRTLAVEWGRFGIRLSCVAPGIIHTEAWERYGLEPEQVARMIPAGVLGTPEQVADAIVFLASPAGDYITGDTLVVDGGYDTTSPSMLLLGG